SIHGQGITPDLIVEREQLKKDDSDEKKKPEEVFDKLEQSKDDKPSVKKEDYDNQLQSAVDVIKTIKIYKSFSAKK
ncbi:MAG: hypothetical protein KBB79_05455, partial [Candidatus Omnitrophica bacterium]|nr:hypothetical protein [Candidatus Omnitrophota bacterium]